MDIKFYEGQKLSKNLNKNINNIKEIFKNDDILRIRELTTPSGLKCALFFFDGMVNGEVLNESVVRPLLTFSQEYSGEKAEFAVEHILFTAETSVSDNLAQMIRNLLYGDTLILFESDSNAVTVNTKGWRTRGISEPGDERVLQGPREGFDESVMLNMAMLRRKLSTPDLKAEFIQSGRRTDTRMFICYLESVVNGKALKELKKRIKEIDIDSILDANYINELINENKFSIFKTAGTTERPDIVAARLLEGRVALFIDGTPVILTVPYLFCENFQSDDDYYQNYTVAFIGRIMRYVSFFLAISIPSVFLALISHHKQLIPTSLYLTISASRNNLPFPSVLECLLLILIFELLRETGLRVPQSMGSALSIVGGLVIGQSAVEAKIVSAPMLIAVAAGGIAGLMVQKLKGAVFYSRIVMVLLCYFFGLTGYFIGITALLTIIFSLNSFGTDYTASLNEISFSSLKDTVFRAPWFKMDTRPVISPNRIRQRRKK
ncbi:MAG: spore germination protein [Ruminococcaceae bacterium]|jgi:spore germination protein KA|nr:spore germination protein [Oscillospiraceae bacterium]